MLKLVNKYGYLMAVWLRVENLDAKTLLSPWGFESLYLIEIVC